jgi:hypothetical protein
MASALSLPCLDAVLAGEADLGDLDRDQILDELTKAEARVRMLQMLISLHPITAVECHTSTLVLFPMLFSMPNKSSKFIKKFWKERSLCMRIKTHYMEFKCCAVSVVTILFSWSAKSAAAHTQPNTLRMRVTGDGKSAVARITAKCVNDKEPRSLMWKVGLGPDLAKQIDAVYVWASIVFGTPLNSQDNAFAALLCYVHHDLTVMRVNELVKAYPGIACNESERINDLK